MLRRFVLLAFAPAVATAMAMAHSIDRAAGGPNTKSFDCAMRKYAYAHGKSLVPRQGKFESLFYALNLNDPQCQGTMAADTDAPAPVTEAAELAADALFVSPTGTEAGTGTKASPMVSVQAAVDLAATRASKTVVLRGGSHFLEQTLMLGPQHSGLHLLSFPGEKAVLSGGKQLKVEWKPFNLKNGSNIYVADVSGQVKTVPGLQLDGVRATRARFPNLPGGIEVSPGYGSMIKQGQANWVKPDLNRFGPVDFYTDNITAHDRTDTAQGWFKHYMIGLEGLCSVYTPSVSYWCSQHPSGGGAFAFRTPTGVTPSADSGLHLPYANPEDAFFFVWRPARWANWMFKVGRVEEAAHVEPSVDASGGPSPPPGKYNFSFGYGGFQGARGSDSGGDYFVENVMEELDFPGEFFFDERTAQLYLYHNGTGAPPASAEVVAPQQQILVNISGTQWDPVSDVKLTGVTYKASSYTYMMPHGVPSAGDWALGRYGAVFLQGTEGALIDGCTFERLDGNAVMVSGYNRNATIKNSDFSYIGGNAIAAWGYTNETATDPGRPGVAIANHPQAGVDGTDGEHPRYTTVLSNTAREVGLYEKQSSFYVQAKTAQSTIHGNVFFNGPRAGINANDGFGGGDEISHNLVFSSCRESGDHGPFNSWDRQPFLTTVRTGKPDMTMKEREIHHNFFIDNYSPQENVDNDDGSSYYNTHHNFFVYGGNGMKNDFGGHDNNHSSNVYAYVGQAIGFYDAPMTEGHEDHFTNNKVVMTKENVGSFTCTGTGKTVMAENVYYTQSGNVTECGQDLAKWMAAGNDKGSSVASLPTDATVIGWAKALLE